MTSELRPAVEVVVDVLNAAERAQFTQRTKLQNAVGYVEADRETVRAYWYRQGKDDGWQMCKENEIDRLREELAEAYIKLSGKSIHTSDCATSNAPAMEPGPCNCDAPGDADLVAKLRDADSYYRIQEKHWCIDGEELERQRLAAADRIEALEAENKRLQEALDGWKAENARLLASVKGWAEDAARHNDNSDYWRQECNRLREALREIIDFGDGDTGYGNSCAKIARAALAGDSHDQ